MPETLDQIIIRAKSKTPCVSNYECLLADLLGIQKSLLAERRELEALKAEMESLQGPPVVTKQYVVGRIEAILHKVQPAPQEQKGK